MILLLVIPPLLLLALLSLASPPTSLLLLVALLPTYLIRFSAFGLPTNFLEAASVLVFLVFYLQPSIRQQWANAWHRLPLPLAILVSLFIVSAVVSTAISSHPITSLGILKSWILIPLLLGWLIFTSSVSDPPLFKLSLLLRSLVVSGNIVAIVGLLQFNHLPRIQSIYDVPNSLALYLVPLLVLSVWLFFCRRQRLFYLPSTLILGAALIATQSVAGLAAAILTVSIGILFFRPLPLTTRLSPSVYLWLFVLVFVFISAGYLTSTGRLAYVYQPLFAPDIHNSLSVRRQLWAISLDLIQANPFLGIGLGDFEPAYQAKLHARFRQYEQCQLIPTKIDYFPLPRPAKPQGEVGIRGIEGVPPLIQPLPTSPYQGRWNTSGWFSITSTNCSRPLSEFVFRDPHNWFLSFWLNTGLLGLVSFILINLYIIFHVRRTWGRSNLWPLTPAIEEARWRFLHPSITTYQTQAITLALFSILVFGLADTIYWKNDLAAQYWIILGLLIAHPLRQPDHSL